MSPEAFLDANIPIYAAGRAHALKQHCAEILLLVPERPQAFITDAEVLQELLQRGEARSKTTSVAWTSAKELG